MAARCLLLVWVKSAKGIPQPRANVFQERGRCWGILPSGGAVLGIVPGHGGHRHRQDLRQPVLDGGDDLEEMKSGLSSQKGITMLRQHRTIPALRLKHRSGSCGTASALPKCSIMSGCGTRIVLRGQKPLALCDRCPCFGSLFPPLAALTFAASSIICAFGLASAAPRSPYRHLELCGIALRILNGTTKKHRTKICLVLFGAPAGIRIPDTLIKSQVLYQLSYGHKYSICLLQLKYCNRYGRKSQAFCRIFSQKICRRAAGAGT